MKSKSATSEKEAPEKTHTEPGQSKALPEPTSDSVTLPEQNEQQQNNTQQSDCTVTEEEARSKDEPPEDEPPEDEQALLEHATQLAKRVAYQTLFRQPQFNELDGLDDYNEDYTQFAPLPSDQLTHDPFSQSRNRVLGSQSTPSNPVLNSPQQIATPTNLANPPILESIELNSNPTKLLSQATSTPELNWQNQASPKTLDLHSQGRLLLIADDQTVLSTLLAAITQHPRTIDDGVPKFAINLVQRVSIENMATASMLTQVANHAQLLGSFTQFSLTVDHQSVITTDLVIDACHTPLKTVDTLGYYYLAPSQVAQSNQLNAIIDDLLEHLGDFAKPIVVEIDNQRCAHGNAQFAGCQRCLSVCEHDAIQLVPLGEKSVGKMVQIDPQLCHGLGDCVSICPTSALQYLPLAKTSLWERVRQLLVNYSDTKPILIFHEQDAPESPITASTNLNIYLDSVALLDVATLLLCLCYGAEYVVIVVKHQRPLANVEFAQQLLERLGYEATRISVQTADTLLENPIRHPNLNALAIPIFSGQILGSKREALLTVLKQLTQPLLTEWDGAGDRLQIDLPVGAELGGVLLQTSACTLCFSCVAVCPTQALIDQVKSVQDTQPSQVSLQFKESACVQCGQCAEACPEQVISLQPRLQLPIESNEKYQLLHQEVLVGCIRCQAPLANQSVLNSIASKLANHPQFQDAAAQRRLKMCADCRVKDLLES